MAKKSLCEVVDGLENKKLLITVKEVAEMLGISVRSVWTLLSTGGLPESVHLGRSRRWRRLEIERWVEAGCPCLEKWNAINLTTGKARGNM